MNGGKKLDTKHKHGFLFRSFNLQQADPSFFLPAVTKCRLLRTLWILRWWHSCEEVLTEGQLRQRYAGWEVSEVQQLWPRCGEKPHQKLEVLENVPEGCEKIYLAVCSNVIDGLTVTSDNNFPLQRRDLFEIVRLWKGNPSAWEQTPSTANLNVPLSSTNKDFLTSCSHLYSLWSSQRSSHIPRYPLWPSFPPLSQVVLRDWKYHFIWQR